MRIKKTKFITLFLTLGLLTSCNIFNFNKNSNSENSESISESISDSIDSVSVSESETSIKKDKTIIDLYCLNDVHGRVSSRKNRSYYEPGVANLATYMKKQYEKNPDGYVFLNAGDLWQDTYDSALNKGELLTKAFDMMNCEAMALGNHEFDWGTSYINKNRDLCENMSFLGCNIFNYDNISHSAKGQCAELCDPYKIIERDGIKIGLIGAIGHEQITSITSSNWENITFVDPVSVVKNYSDYLRKDEGCDVIVYLFHGSLEQSSYKELASYSPVTNKRYVDAGFLGHSHYGEEGEHNGASFIQSACHSEYVGHIQLEVDEYKNVVTRTHSSYDDRYSYGFGNGKNSIYSQEEDPEIKQLVDSYLTEEFIASKNEIVGHLANYSTYTIGNEIGKILGKATYDYILDLKNDGIDELKNVDVDVVINNGGRDTINLDSEKSLSRETLFNLTPFTNKTIIANVRGKDIINECINYSNYYYTPHENGLKIVENNTYTVAVIDYLLTHKNESRNFNYFTSYNGVNTYVIEKYPYEITIDYFLKNKTFDASYDTLFSKNYTGLYV